MGSFTNISPQTRQDLTVELAAARPTLGEDFPVQKNGTRALGSVSSALGTADYFRIKTAVNSQGHS